MIDLEKVAKDALKKYFNTNALKVMHPAGKTIAKAVYRAALEEEQNELRDQVCEDGEECTSVVCTTLFDQIERLQRKIDELEKS